MRILNSSDGALYISKETETDSYPIWLYIEAIHSPQFHLSEFISAFQQVFWNVPTKHKRKSHSNSIGELHSSQSTVRNMRPRG